MNISDYYIKALLAQAAYAEELTDGLKGESLANRLFGALKDKGMTKAQADYIGENFEVVTQQDTTDSGFSATVFKRVSDSSIYFSMRGTDFQGEDITNNIQNIEHGISYDQVADLLNFYFRLTHTSTETVAQFAFEEQILASDAPPPSVPHVIIGTLDTPTITKIRYAVFSEVASENGLEAITSDQELSLAGHSLGGHLASVFTLLFPNIVNSTATYNSAGFIGNRFDEFANVISKVVNANGVTNLNPDLLSNSSVNVLNIRSLLDPISNRPILNAYHLGGQSTDVFIESNSLVTSHGIDSLVDSLAVINFLNTLDKNVTLESASKLLMNSSNSVGVSLESMMWYMAELFSEISVAKTDSDHDGIYSVIAVS